MSSAPALLFVLAIRVPHVAGQVLREGLGRRWAAELAREAVTRLFDDGLFHPARPYYEATNGVGLLLWALLELSEPGVALVGAF